MHRGQKNMYESWMNFVCWWFPPSASWRWPFFLQSQRNTRESKELFSSKVHQLSWDFFVTRLTLSIVQASLLTMDGKKWIEIYEHVSLLAITKPVCCLPTWSLTSHILWAVTPKGSASSLLVDFGQKSCGEDTNVQWHRPFYVTLWQVFSRLRPVEDK